MILKILTPEKKIFEGSVDVITIPTTLGLISILSNHAPLVSNVIPGEILVKNKDYEKIFINERGVVQTINNQTSILLTKCNEKS
ncbi:MAG: F0F1 ATP synthase subunit epsilon [Candidatus Pacebacteria bacterium]|nr:F0F1 ATP synthase subunit epsilon [Candidatus Paceibacterota bacterium]MDD4074067.1 F0F1 ATP synthase subunit epsilon [Candidatus Paceibacterota bacterium]